MKDRPVLLRRNILLEVDMVPATELEIVGWGIWDDSALLVDGNRSWADFGNVSAEQ